MAVLIVVGNILGRLSVGWVGLTYDVDDTEVNVVDALRGAWWPNTGENLERQGVFETPPMGAPALQDVMRMVAITTPFPQQVEIQFNNSSAVNQTAGGGGIRDWSLFDVPKLTRDINVAEGTVKYTYTFEDEGGVDGNHTRTLQVLGQCQLTNFLDFKGMKTKPSQSDIIFSSFC